MQASKFIMDMKIQVEYMIILLYVTKSVVGSSHHGYDGLATDAICTNSWDRSLFRDIIVTQE